MAGLRRLAPVLLVSLLLAACGGRVAGAPNSPPAHILSSPDQLSKIAAGRPTVFLFTATGCASCVADVKGLQQALAGHQAIQAVGVDTATTDIPDDLEIFLEDEGISAAPLIWVIDRGSVISSRYGVALLGATVGIDRQGKVRFTNRGPTDWRSLSAQLLLLES